MESYEPRDIFDVTSPISCGDIDKDDSLWNNNEMQKEALDKLYSIGEEIRELNDKDMFMAWELLQSSDHILYISSKRDSYANIYSPYSSIYEAFINYMNILSDFMLRLEQKREKAQLC